MLKTYLYPPKYTWDELIKRPAIDPLALNEQVRCILDDVKQDGDKALIEFNEKFDGVRIDKLLVSSQELQEAEKLVPATLKAAIRQAAANISKFHETQLEAPVVIETMPGVKCWRKSVGIEKVGLYIPGGSAPLFSTVLMLAIPAKIASCRSITLCTPPDKDGKINPAILFAAQLCGISKIVKVGGAQAIGALAYGTESVDKCYKIFGPGNQYVTCAKMLVSLEGTAIDMPAGPSELAVIADNTAIPEFVAADLLSQAEHGADSQVVLFTTLPEFPELVNKALKEQVKDLPRSATALKALKNSKAIVLENDELLMELTNLYAPEHLIIATKNTNPLADRVTNAGSVFLGNYTPESAGDYASGTNHTLPTNGYAKMYSGVSVESFVKKISFQEITKKGLELLGPTIEIMAEAEQLEAHKYAVSIRIRN